MKEQEISTRMIWIAYIAVGGLMFGLGFGTVIFYELEQTKLSTYGYITIYVKETYQDHYTINSQDFGNLSSDMTLPTKFVIGQCYEVLLHLPSHGISLFANYTTANNNNCYQ